MADQEARDLARQVAPATHAVAVTPSNTVDLTIPCRALYVGTGGDLVVITTGGDTCTFTGVPSGAVLSVACSRVKATGTTATGVVALW